MTASYASHEVQLTLMVEPNVPAQLVLSVELTTVPADRVSMAVITVAVTDAWDNLIADGTSVTFSTTAGTLNTNTVLTKDGLATATLTSAPVSGNALVAVTAGEIQEIIEIGFEVTASESRIYLPLYVACFEFKPILTGYGVGVSDESEDHDRRGRAFRSPVSQDWGMRAGSVLMQGY